MNDTMEQLEEEIVRAKEEGPSPSSYETWISDPGDHVVGEVTDFSQKETDYQESEIATIRGKLVKADEDEPHTGKILVWLLHSQLQRKFDERDISVGDRVAIARHEDVQDRREAQYSVRTLSDLESNGAQTVDASDVDDIMSQ